MHRPHTRELLFGFLRGDPASREELPRRLHPRLVRLARRLAPDLADRDLHEDAAQRTWELLLRRPRLDYDPHRGSPMAYLATILRNAIADVRAEHAPPGEAARPRPNRTGGCPLRLRKAPPSWPPRADGPKYELLADPDDGVATAPERLDAALLIRLAHDTAPRPVLFALVLVYANGTPLGEVARALGLSRATLRRRIDAWAAEHDLRLVA